MRVMEYKVKELTSDIVKNWVSMATGPFSLQDMWREIDIVTPEGKNTLRVTMHRLCNDGIVERVNNRDGVFRPIDGKVVKMDWKHADPKNTVPLLFPFELESYAVLYPKSIVIVAGAKNAGKTAFLYNLVVKNMGRFKVDLFNSETGPEQMNVRFNAIDPNIPDPPPFETYERYDNFADVIDPDHISVIDYLDMNSELYLVGEEIDRIFRKLNKGVAVIGLQKPPPLVSIYKGKKKTVTRDLAYGGGFTAKRAILYISLDTNLLKLVYVKNPKDPKCNPNNMMWSYLFSNSGSEFINIQRHYENDFDDNPEVK